MGYDFYSLADGHPFTFFIGIGTIIICQSKTYYKKKNQLLDHLISRFAERFSEYAFIMKTIYGESNANYEVLKAKAKFVMGDEAYVDGNVMARNAEVAGKVKGNIEISELLILKPSAVINGDILTNKLVVAVPEAVRKLFNTSAAQKPKFHAFIFDFSEQIEEHFSSRAKIIEVWQKRTKVRNNVYIQEIKVIKYF